MHPYGMCRADATAPPFLWFVRDSAECRRNSADASARAHWSPSPLSFVLFFGMGGVLVRQVKILSKDQHLAARHHPNFN